MSTREDLAADARHEMELDRQYFEHEEFHVEPSPGCWLCERDAEEDKNEDVHPV